MEIKRTVRLRGFSTLAAVLSASAFGGCVGVVEPGQAIQGGSGNPNDPANPVDPNVPQDPNNPIAPNNPNSPGISQNVVVCPNTTAGSPLAVPLQRITDTQYNAMIADLFGSKVTAQTAFPAPLIGYLYSTYSGANPMGEAQVQAVLDAAEAVASQVADIVPACSSVAAETSCATTYLTNLASRAFRRTATSNELAVIMGAYTNARPTLSYGESVAVGVEMILQMPQFLYILETQPTTAGAAPTTLTGPELAQRMALLYWNGLPDQTLLNAAASGALADPSNRLTQAQRMLQDPRAHGVFTDFLLQWMTVKGFHADVHTADIQAALDEELTRDIDHALGTDAGLHDLVASQQTFVNSVLETFYGLPAQSAGPTDWHLADLGPDQRVGILTHPLLLAKFAHGQIGSPILRGKFIRIMMMCDNIAPPPAGAQAAQNTLTPMGATVREQSQARIDNATCGVCHKLMDPIGFGFSAFDGVGHFVPTAGGQPVDVSGHIESASDLGGDFSGVRALGDKLAQSPKVAACLAAQWMRYAFGTQETSADQCTVQALATRFSQQNDSLTALFAGLSALDSFAQRRAVTEGP